MKKVVRIGGYIIAGMAALAVLIIIILKLISDNQYKEWITAAVQSSTGRDFSIETLELDFNTTLKVKANQVQLANASWSEQPQMLSLKDLQAEIDLLKLISGTAVLRGKLDELNVVSETSEEGISNWALSTDSKAEQQEDQQQTSATEPELPLDFIIREFKVNNSSVKILRPDEKKNVSALIEEFVVETPDIETSFNLKANVNSTPLQLSGELGQLSGLIYNHSSPLKLQGKVGENNLSVNGEWGPFLPQPDLDINTDINIIAPTPLAELIGIDIIDFGVMKFSSRLYAKDGQFSISEIVTDLDGTVTDLQVAGSVDDLLNLKGLRIDTKANTLELSTFLKKLNIELPFDLPPKVDVAAVFHGGLEKLGAEDIVVAVVDEGLEGKFTGLIENAIGVKGIDGQIVVSANSTTDLSKYAGFNIPDFGKVEITANIVSKDDKTSLTDLDATLNSENIQMNVTGSIEDLQAIQGIQAVINANIASLTTQNISEIQTLLDHFQVNAPLQLLPESAMFQAKLNGNLNRLSLSDINAEINDQDITVMLSGQIADLLTTSGLDAAFTFNSDSLSSLSKYAKIELPVTNALDVSGQILSSNESFSLNDLKASLLAQGLDVRLDASIDDLLKISGINAEINSQIESLSALSTLTQIELPETDPVTLQVSLKSDHNNGSNPTAISVSATSKDTKVNLDADLNDLMSAENILAAINIETVMLSDLNQFTGIELPDQGPLKLSGNVKVEGKNYGLHDFQLRLDDQAVNGWVSANLPESENGITSVNGEIDIPYFDLTPFMKSNSTPESNAEAVSNENIPVPENDATTASDRLFTNDALNLKALRGFNADISINAKKLKARKANITDVAITIATKDGLLTVDPLRAVSHGGDLNGKIMFDGQKDNAILDVDLVVENFPIMQLEGTYNLNLNLDGDGSSMAELMGGLNGQIIVVLNEAKIESSFATSFGSGLFSFSGDKDYTELECGILRMDIVDGIADFDDKLAVQLTEVTWHGGGDINFKNEKIGIAVVPKARKGIGIGAGSLASLFYVGGTLKNPKVQLNPTDVAVKYGKYMAHVSTGGLSLLVETLYNKLFANQDLCEKILDGTVFDEDPEESEDKSKEPGRNRNG